MSKYGKQQKRTQKRDEKALMQGFRATQIWSRDRSREVEESTEKVSVGLTSRGQITQRVVRYKGTNQVVEFAVTYAEQDGEDHWQELLCIDTCNHGTVHRHLNGDHDTEPEVIVEITSQEVLHEQLFAAIGEAHDAVNWGE